MTTTPNPEELFEFPCDHTFKAIGSADPAFAEAVLEAVNRVVPVSRDAMHCRPSSGDKFQSVSVLVRVQNYPQVVAIYAELKLVAGLRYLL